MPRADIMEPLVLGNLIILVIMTMLLSASAEESLASAPVESLQDILVYAMEPPSSNIQKRETTQGNKMSDDDFHKYIERKLTQHTRALEHLLQVTQNNEDLTKKLIDNFGSYLPEPKMPEKLQVMSRRSFDGRQVSVPVATPPQKISPWCSVASVCRRSLSSVCGYDDNFGYGRFDDVCHMLQVNCYWKYNFGLVAHCRPILN